MIIKLIGIKRAILLAVALALNGVIAAAYITGVEPMRADEERKLQEANGRISQLAQDIQSVKAQLAKFPSDYARYQELGVKGFFSVQDRFDAGRRLDALRQRAGLLGYSYKIDALKALSDPRADAAAARLIRSRITLEKISSVLDTEVFALMRAVVADFPQHVRISKIDVKRLKDIDAAVLKSMEVAPVPLVEATAVFDWYTVAPQDSTSSAPVQPGGFRGR